MAISAKRTIRAARKDGEDITEALMDQIAVLRKELAEITDAVNDYSGNAFHDVQQNAVAIAKEVRHQGSIALLSALLFTRD